LEVDGVKEGVKQLLKAMECRQPKRGFWKYENIREAIKDASFEYNEIEKKNPNISRVEINWWSTRCYLIRAFEPAVITVIENFMNRNVARSVSPWEIPREQEKRVPGSSPLRWITYGQRDAPWLATVDYFATVMGNDHCQKLTGLTQAVASCGFVWIKPDRVIDCDRPDIAKFDDQGRPHCEDGPAIVYGRDGERWRFFYLNGVPTPKKYIETPADDLKFDEVLKEPNSAVRMAVIKKFGFARLLATTRNRIVSEAEGNSLIEFKLRIGDQHNEYLRALRLKWQDKTGAKETMLPVPRLAAQFGADCPANINDCEQVRRWTLGWPKEAMAVAET
jgi:uncharacterized protein DUF6745